VDVGIVSAKLATTPGIKTGFFFYPESSRAPTASFFF